MARRIKAKSLGALLTRYVDGALSEAAEHVKDSEPYEGAELLAMLPEDRAWRLLRALPPVAARRWLASSSDDEVRRLIRRERPDAALPPEEDRKSLEEKAVAILTTASISA